MEKKEQPTPKRISLLGDNLSIPTLPSLLSSKNKNNKSTQALRRSGRQSKQRIQLKPILVESDSEEDDKEKNKKTKRKQSDSDDQIKESSSSHPPKKRSRSSKPSSSDKRFPSKCPLCPEMMTSSPLLYQHVDKTHFTHQQGQDGVKVKGYICPAKNCNKFFSSLYLFVKHLNRSHLPPGSNAVLPKRKWKKIAYDRHKAEPYPCEICGKKVLSKESVLKHKAFHVKNKSDPTKTEECLVCHIFFKPARFQMHMMLHRKDNPFQCKVADCGKKFDGRASLEKHMRLHLERKKLTCPYCPGTYSTEKYLRFHLNKWHPTKESRGKDNLAAKRIPVRATPIFFVKPIEGLAEEDVIARRPTRKVYTKRKKRKEASSDEEDDTANVIRDDMDDKYSSEESDENGEIKEERHELDSVDLNDDFERDQDLDDSDISSEVDTSTIKDDEDKKPLFLSKIIKIEKVKEQDAVVTTPLPPKAIKTEPSGNSANLVATPPELVSEAIKTETINEDSRYLVVYSGGAVLHVKEEPGEILGLDFD